MIPGTTRYGKLICSCFASGPKEHGPKSPDRKNLMPAIPLSGVAPTTHRAKCTEITVQTHQDLRQFRTTVSDADTLSP